MSEPRWARRGAPWQALEAWRAAQVAGAQAAIDLLSEAHERGELDLDAYRERIRDVSRELWRAMGQPEDGIDEWVRRTVDEPWDDAAHDVRAVREAFEDDAAWRRQDDDP